MVDRVQRQEDDAAGRSGVTQLRGGMDDDADAELEEGEACGNDTAFVRGPGNARGSRRPAGKPERRLLARRRDSGSVGPGAAFAAAATTS
jgi:hypothetical protein